MSLEPLLDADLVIQVHVLAAVSAFLLGALVLFRRKGDRLHKALGRVWAGLMLVVAISSFFITGIGLIGPFSPIHLLSLYTVAGLAYAIWQIRRGNVAAHKGGMQSLYLGGLLIAGGFTFLPGRRMHQALFGDDAGWTPSLIVIGLSVLAAAAVHWRLRGAARPRSESGGLLASADR